ncbi:MAG: hypothetical protein JNL94_16575, partial [Planctomycetes bacterium]|nr:hypothetical protein [Planctomycetota bacterium]
MSSASSSSILGRVALTAAAIVGIPSAVLAQGPFTYLPGPAYDVTADGSKVVGTQTGSAYIYDVVSSSFNLIGPASSAFGIS